MDFKELPKEEQLKIVAQLESIRRDGKFNMFDFRNVQKEAFDRDFYAFVGFTENNHDKYSQILEAYETLIDEIDEEDIP